MTLREYLIKNNMKLSTFSQIAGYRAQSLCNCLNGCKRAGRIMRLDIRKATGGAVGIDDWPIQQKKFDYAGWYKPSVDK